MPLSKGNFGLMKIANIPDPVVVLCEGEILKILSVHAWAFLGNRFYILIRAEKQRVSAICVESLE
jgi:hypothetical protein